MRTQKLFYVVALAAIVTSGAALAETSVSPTNLRSGPGEAWPVIGTVPAGAKLKVLSCSSGWGGGWCNVRVGAASGYVAAGALATYGSSVGVAPVVTNDVTRMHAGPSLYSSTVKVIPGGEAVDMIRCRSGFGRGWCQVRYDNQTGYVRGGLLARQGAVY
jgi:uncharacterized protein YraI